MTNNYYKGTTLTNEQSNAARAISANKSCKIQAPAGSGKTLSLLSGARKLSGYGLNLSFNKSIAIQAAKKFPSNIMCKTGHSLAFGTIGYKYSKRLQKITGGSLANSFDIGKISHFRTSANKGYHILETIRNYCYSSDKNIEVWHVPKIIIKVESSMYKRLVENIKYFSTLVWQEMIDVNSTIPITHDVYLKLWALSKPILRKNFILFDEAQDANPVMLDVIMNQKNTQLVFVGDTFQQIYCQPAGTIIAMAKCRGQLNFPKSKPIEDVKVGEHVITFDDSYVFPTGNPVESITEINYEGKLIVTTTDAGCISKYIPQHQCMIRISQSMEDKHIVYLMQKGNQFRIGKVPYLYKSQYNTFGLNARASVEQADMAWILSVQNSSEEATLYEAIYQAQFGIPGVCWREQDKHRIDVDYFWGFIGDNTKRGKNCLQGFNLLIDMPLWKKGHETTIGLRRVTITAAANIHTGMLMLPLKKALRPGQGNRNATAKHWEKIYTQKENYKGKVFSLQIKKYHNYFADGLLTHNSWRGAVNALQNIDLPTYYITKSFRFGQDIADIANNIIESYAAPKTRIPKIIGNCKKSAEVVTTNDLVPDCIICRTNAGVIFNIMKYLRNDHSVYILGGVTQLINLIRGIQELKATNKSYHPELLLFDTYEDLLEYAESPMGGDIRYIIKAIKKYGFETIIDSLNKTEEAELDAEITITTVHKAKGLEWPIVKLGNDFAYPEIGESIKAEEVNILYVAATRALDILIIHNCDALHPDNLAIGAENWTLLAKHIKKEVI